MAIIFWDFVMFYQIFLSLQVKRSVIISNKHGINKLLNELRLRISGNLEILEKSQIFIDLYSSAQSLFQKEHFANTSKKLLKNRHWTFPVVNYFIWKLEFISNILCTSVTGNSFLLLNQSRSLQSWFVWQFW